MAMASGKQPTVLQMSIIEHWAKGFSNDEIAALLNCSVETVKNTKKIDTLKQKYYELQHEQITNLIPLAIKRLSIILNDDKTQASVHVAAIKEVLDRAHLSDLMDNSNKDIRVTVSYE